MIGGSLDLEPQQYRSGKNLELIELGQCARDPEQKSIETERFFLTKLDQIKSSIVYVLEIFLLRLICYLPVADVIFIEPFNL